MKERSTEAELFDLSHPQTAEAIRLHLIGDREGARRALDALLREDPRNHYFHYLLGETSYATGLLEEAVTHYQKAIELKPDFGVAYYKMGVCLHRQGQLERSLECFSVLLRMKGQGHAMASYFFGLINQFLGNDDAAEEGFRVLRHESPQSLIANYYLAQIKLKHNRHQEALDLLEELLRATPNLAEVHFQKAVVYMGMHKNMEAISSLRTTLKLNPNDKRAQGYLEMLTEVPEI
jgi:predicted Zn-dependent protease